VDGQPDLPVDGPKADQLPGGDGGVVPGTWGTIVPGTFTMGSSKSEPCRLNSSEDQHQVTLTHGFEIQSTEVTQGEFSSVMGYNLSYFGPGGGGTNCGTSCPVETVNWSEAAAYSGQKVYTCPGYRLPTADKIGWYCANARSTTHHRWGRSSRVVP
jgi:formylglycine-generating enzyme required for sulfatase activity